jgi:hypothetical protein
MTRPAGPGSDGYDVAARKQDVVGRLKRWQEFGAVWRVASQAAGSVTISLCRCDDAEEIDRLTSNDPDLLGWLGGRTSSEP